MRIVCVVCPIFGMNRSLLPRPSTLRLISRQTLVGHMVRNPHVCSLFGLNCFQPAAFQEVIIAHSHFVCLFTCAVRVSMETKIQ